MNAKQDTPSTGQERAIRARGRHLLVSASAGSGKTYTLVERIVRHIVEGVYGIDELLVVTFTNAAAAEMRERIEKRLAEAMGDHPALSRQLVLLAGASISTLHSFCQRLIRDHVASLDVSPKFRLVSGAERELMRYRVVERLFEEKYEARDEGFLDFVGKYGSDRDDEALYRMTMELAEFAQSRPDPSAWLRGLSARFALPRGAAIEDTIWYPDLRLHIGRGLAACRDAAKWLAAQAERYGFDDGAGAFRDDEALVARLSDAFDAGRWEPLAAAFAEAFAAKTVFTTLHWPKGVDAAEKKYFTDAREKEIKRPLKALRDAYFSEDAAALLDDVRAAGAEAAELCRLASDFLQAFRTEKRKKETLDFGDLEHLALALLANEELAGALRTRYKEIMVDEYQDTNGVQEEILRRITNGRNLFMVGDVKQSIYRFRLADPTLFMEKQEARDGSVECIELGENYRSRPDILRAVNFLFVQLMARPGMEMDYDAKAKLTPKADYPAAEEKSFAQTPVELLIVEAGPEIKEAEASEETEEGAESLAGFAAEAEMIAKRLRALKDSGTLAYDKDERAYHPVRWRDMAILLRAAKGGKAQTLVEALRAHDIPAYAEADAGYFAETEVRLMLSLLAVIDNAHQDIPLAAVLRSVVVGMTSEALAGLRAGAPSGDMDFYDALVLAAEKDGNEKAARFLEKLARWRTLSRRVGVPELLWRLYRETGYYDYVGAQPGGLVRQANLRMLADRAADYEKTNFRGLFRFLQFVRRMKARGTDLSVARTLGENEDVVRVMTVHKSKGLEFPVVVLAGLSKGFNLRDAQSSFLVHGKLGLGLYRTETAGTLTWRYPTIARRAVAERIRTEAQAEEMRVLYVALTRAREKLILTGSVASLGRRASLWCRYAGQRKTVLPGHAVLGAGNWLDWIGMALVRSDAGGELREAAGFEAPVAMDYDAETFGVPRFEVRILPAPSAAAEAEKEEDGAWIKRIREKKPLPVAEVPAHRKALSWSYAFPTDIPAKMTVTELKRRFAETEEAPHLAPEIVPPSEASDDLARDFPPPAFLAETPLRDGASFGTLMHAVLQRLPLDGALDAADIDARLDAFVQDGAMDEEERRAVSVDSLARFFASPLGRRMRAARRVWREQPFSLLIPAAELGMDAPAEDEVFVQGVIDVFFEEADGRRILLDYKTDRHTTVEAIRARYRRQLEIYARAIRSVLGQEVDEIYIYRLADGDAVKL